MVYGWKASIHAGSQHLTIDGVRRIRTHSVRRNVGI